MLLWLIVAGVMALGPVVRSYIGIYDWFKGKTIDTSNFVTRSELAAIKAERDVQIAATIAEIKSDFDRVETLLTDLTRDMPAIHRALGRLEGHDDAATPPRRRSA